MAISVRAESDPDRPLGHARIIVGGLPSMPAETGFVIRREGYERGNLGPRGWQVSEAKLKPLAARQSGDSVVLSIGPDIVRHMEAGPAIFAWPAAHIETALFWPDDIDVFDGELPRDAPEPPPPPPPAVATSLPEPAVITPAPAAILETAPSSQPARSDAAAAARDTRTDTAGGSKAMLALLALLAIGAAAAACWYFLYGPGAAQQQTAQAPAPAPAPAPATPRPAPPAPTWPEGTDSLSLQELVAKAPSVLGIHAAALRRQAAGRHDDALVLFEEAAEKGHAPALTALARLYDPVGFEPGKPFRSPDPRAAARYYRDAVQKGDAAATEHRAALKTFLEGQAAANPSAADALKEFWP
jgi:hypothetical protein